MPMYAGVGKLNEKQFRMRCAIRLANTIMAQIRVVVYYIGARSFSLLHFMLNSARLGGAKCLLRTSLCLLGGTKRG
jgi:hypothetical protein